MKILFLDVDGVLNLFGDSFRSFKREDSNPLELIQVQRLEYILEKVPDLNIVVSSSWSQDTLIEKLLKYRFKYISRIIGRTPRIIQGDFNEETKRYSLFRTNRGEQIQAYLDEAKEQFIIDRYLVIDDEIFDIIERSNPKIPKEHVFEIDMHEGLSNKDSLLCVDYFNEPNFDYLYKILITLNEKMDTEHTMDELYICINPRKRYYTSTSKNLKSTIKRLVDSERMTRIVNFEEPKSILSYLERKLIKEERCTNILKSLYAQNKKN